MLKTNVEFRKGILFIRLTGELNEKNYLEGENGLQNFLEENSFLYIVFNFEKLISIDVSCINYILKYVHKIKKNDGKIFLCESRKIYHRLFKNNLQTIKKETEVFNLI